MPVAIAMVLSSAFPPVPLALASPRFLRVLCALRITAFALALVFIIAVVFGAGAERAVTQTARARVLPHVRETNASRSRARTTRPLRHTHCHSGRAA